MIEEMLGHPKVEQILIYPYIIAISIPASRHLILHPQMIELLCDENCV